MPWWEGKQKIREYLKEVNNPTKVSNTMNSNDEAETSSLDPRILFVPTRTIPELFGISTQNKQTS